MRTLLLVLGTSLHTLVLLLLVAPTTTRGASPASSRDTSAPRESLDRVLTAMEKGLDFYLREYARLNLDAVIGTRLVEGKRNFVYICISTFRYYFTLFYLTFLHMEQVFGSYSTSSTGYMLPQSIDERLLRELLLGISLLKYIYMRNHTNV